MRVMQVQADGRRKLVDVVPLGGRGLAVLDFGTGKTDASVAVSAPAITSSSVVLARLMAMASPEHSADEHLIEELEVMAGAPTTGVGFTIYGRTRNLELYGRWNVAWMWG